MAGVLWCHGSMSNLRRGMPTAPAGQRGRRSDPGEMCGLLFLLFRDITAPALGSMGLPAWVKGEGQANMRLFIQGGRIFVNRRRNIPGVDAVMEMEMRLISLSSNLPGNDQGLPYKIYFSPPPSTLPPLPAGHGRDPRSWRPQIISGF